VADFSADGFLAKVRATSLWRAGRLAGGRDARRGGSGEEGEGDRLEARAGTGTTSPPSRTFPAFCDKFLSKFPTQLRPLDVVLLHGFILEQLLGISPRL